MEVVSSAIQQACQGGKPTITSLRARDSVLAGGGVDGLVQVLLKECLHLEGANLSVPSGVPEFAFNLLYYMPFPQCNWNEGLDLALWYFRVKALECYPFRPAASRNLQAMDQKQCAAVKDEWHGRELACSQPRAEESVQKEQKK
eukprot:1161716-Pelagomonas_calceolata.AAC.7